MHIIIPIIMPMKMPIIIPIIKQIIISTTMPIHIMMPIIIPMNIPIMMPSGDTPRLEHSQAARPEQEGIQEYGQGAPVARLEI